MSADHKADREPLLKALTDQQIEVKIQEHFSLNGHPTLEGLHDYVRSCSHVVHIVGPTPGGIPAASSVEQLLASKPQVATALARHGVPAAGLTYTQWEAWFAIAYDRPLLLYSPKAFLDATLALSATPLEDLPSQQAHLRRLTTQDRWPYGFETTDKLTIEVLRKLVPEGAGDSGPEVDLGRLPQTFARRLFGREAEMKQLLEAWDSDATRIVALDAMGGAGKTALAWHFKELLKRTGWRGVRRAFAWSFYSQGSNEDRQTSADEFFAEALKFFGHDGSAFNSEHDKGAQLARLVAADRNLLILDGLEPLQYYAGSTGGAEARKDGGRPRREGGLKDQAMAALVRGLADAAHGLTLITTRLMVTELSQHAAPNVIHLEVRQLPLPAAIALLRSRGVCPEFPANQYAAPAALREPDDGLPDDAPELPASEANDLADLARSLRCHALAINLAASWLVTHHGGDVRPWRHELPDLPELADENERDPYRVMRAIEIALGRDAKDGSEAATLQLAILFCLGLFDRPMEPEPFKALRDKPALPGPMAPLSDASQNQLDKAVESLTRKGLVDKDAGAARNQDIDCHPLVREYFGARLAQLDSEIFRTAHSRLYDHYRYSAKGPNGEVLPQEFRNPVGYGILALWCNCITLAQQRGEDHAVVLRQMMKRIIDDEVFRTTADLPPSLKRASTDELRAMSVLIDGPGWNIATIAFLPDDEAGLAPLFSAIRHGCFAERDDECFNEVYWSRVARGNMKYASQHLGLYAPELAALANFFADAFARPSPRLSPIDQPMVANLVGFRLRALGRLEDAVEPMRLAAAIPANAGDWANAASGSANLAELLLTLGRLDGNDGAIAAAEKCVTYAAQSHVSEQRAGLRGVSVDVELSAGRLAVAEEHLNEAERLLKINQPSVPRVHSVSGYIAANFLWDRGRFYEAAVRARWLVKVEHLGGSSLITKGLAELTLARAGGAPEQLRFALASIRKANQEAYVVPSLLALAESELLSGDLGSAVTALAEAEGIARRGPMPLFAADAALMRARLALISGDHRAARSKRDEAAALIARHGYGRRRPDLAVLDAELNADAIPEAQRVLGEGWWALIPRLEVLGVDCTQLRESEAAWNAERDAYLRSTLERNVRNYNPIRDPILAYLGLDPATIGGHIEPEPPVDPDTIPDSLVDSILADSLQLQAHNEVLAESNFSMRFDELPRDDQKAVIAAIITAQRASPAAVEDRAREGQIDPESIPDSFIESILANAQHLQAHNAILAANNIRDRFEDMPREEQKRVVAAIMAAQQQQEAAADGRGASPTDIPRSSVPDTFIEEILANPEKLQAHNELLTANNISQRFEAMTRDAQKELVALIMTAQREEREQRALAETEPASASAAPVTNAASPAPKKKGWLAGLFKRR